MKVGFVGLVGLPNAGKSTLVNAIIGEKVGIISKKPQTTRRRVLGVYTDKDSQICFVDAPGFIKSDTGFNNYLQKELEGVIRDSDVCLAVLNLDAHKVDYLLEIVELVKQSRKPWAILISKTDLEASLGQGQREIILQSRFADLGVPIITGSALNKKDKLKDKLLPILKELLPDSEHPLYPDDIFTTQTSRELVSEIVREKCFEYLHQEIPYGLAVKVLKYDESEAIPKIYVDIIVSKENFVSMVVGQNGAMIKRIGASSRIECERVLGQKIFLQTHVKVKKDWFKNPDALKELGYVLTE